MTREEALREALRWVREDIGDLPDDEIIAYCDGVLAASALGEDELSYYRRVQMAEGALYELRTVCEEILANADQCDLDKGDGGTVIPGPLMQKLDRILTRSIPIPQQAATEKSWPEVTLPAGAWRSLVAGLDEEGAEHETPITVCYDAEHDQGIYCYAEYPDDGARTIGPAPPASAPAAMCNECEDTGMTCWRHTPPQGDTP